MPDAAALVCRQMEAAGVAADCMACAPIFAVQNSCGQPEKALQLWETLKSQGVQLNDAAYKELFVACNK